MRKNLSLLALLGLAASAGGCGEGWPTILQAEKNVRNEFADCLHKIRDEESAKRIIEGPIQKIKTKWADTKMRRQKFLKTNFLDTAQKKVEDIKKNQPGLSMDEVLNILKNETPPLKKEMLQEIKDRLSIPAEAQHHQELEALQTRIQTEISRINGLLADLSRENPQAAPSQEWPNLSKAGNLAQEIFSKDGGF